MGFFQGCPTHPSVSNVNPAPTVQKLDLPAVPPALRKPTPTKVPLFAFSVIKTNIQVCMFTFLKLCPQRPNTSLNLQLHKIAAVSLSFAFAMDIKMQCWGGCSVCFRIVLSLDYSVKCIVCCRSFLPDVFPWLDCFFFPRGWFRELQTETCVHKQRLLLHPHSLWLWGTGKDQNESMCVEAEIYTDGQLFSFYNEWSGRPCGYLRAASGLTHVFTLGLPCLFQTQLMYKWIEPKICSETVTGAVNLPASGEKQTCPPCNPGFFVTNSSTCEPCDKGFYSNGTGAASVHSVYMHANMRDRLKGFFFVLPKIIGRYLSINLTYWQVQSNKWFILYTV